MYRSQCANSFILSYAKEKALRVEIHDASATRTRISSFYLGRRSTRQRHRHRPFFLSISATELRHRAHPSRQRPRRSTPIGDVRTSNTLHRRSDRTPSLARRAAARRDARGPTESRTIARWGQRGEPSFGLSSFTIAAPKGTFFIFLLYLSISHPLPQSLTWLLHNYFLPTLNPSPAQSQSHSHSQSIRPVEPLLKRYKNLLKTVSRDASLRTRHAADISGVVREIGRWLAEARVAAVVHAASEFASSSWLSYRGGRHRAGEPVALVVDNGDEDDGGDDEEPEPREAWALDRLCDALLVKGALVPISRKLVIDVFLPAPTPTNPGEPRKNRVLILYFPCSFRKRVSSKGSPHHPPSSLLMIWVPLLESVAADHAHFPAVLTSHVITHLLSDDDNPPPAAAEPEPGPDDNTNATTAAAEKASYDVCLANWATWLIEWRRSADETDVDVTARRQSVFFQLAQALIVSPNSHKDEHEQEQEPSLKSPQTGCVCRLSPKLRRARADRLTI